MIFSSKSDRIFSVMFGSLQDPTTAGAHSSQGLQWAAYKFITLKRNIMQTDKAIKGPQKLCG